MADMEGPVAIETAEFDTLAEVYRPKIFRYALASLRDADAAATITQDCLLKAYEARERFRHECSLHTWLMQIAVNLVRDHLRNRRFRFWRRVRYQAKPIGEVGERLRGDRRTPEQQLLLQEQVAAIWEATKSLSERQRTVFLLRFVEEMDLLEIAAVTGMKEGTVKSHLFRALQVVRERVGVLP